MTRQFWTSSLLCWKNIAPSAVSRSSAQPFHSPLDLLAEIEKGTRYDILFLDVIMPAENGITAAKEIRQYDNVVKIIFLTSSAEFAVESYVVGAYFYQIKPIWEDSFFRSDGFGDRRGRADQRSLILRCKTGISRIDLDQLLYCEVLGRTLLFHLVDGTVLESTGSMDELARQLTPHESFFCARTALFLVNMEYIQNISTRAVTPDKPLRRSPFRTESLLRSGGSIWNMPSAESR